MGLTPSWDTPRGARLEAYSSDWFVRVRTAAAVPLGSSGCTEVSLQLANPTECSPALGVA